MLSSHIMKKQLPRTDLKFEKKLAKKFALSGTIAGLDEVGRGCLAGPVVAAALVPGEVDRRKFRWLSRVTDSKLLDAAEREDLAARLKEWSPTWATAEASVSEIDEINILRASHVAMIRALEKLTPLPAGALIDGHMLPRLPADYPVKMDWLIKGDSKSLSIAGASIIAKVERDQLMRRLGVEHPAYGFASNKGYPTPDHRTALVEAGVTVHHRRSFGPVRALLESLHGL